MLLLAPGFRFLTSVLVTFAVFIEHVLYAGYCFRYQRTKGTCGACFLVREKVKKYIVYKWGAPWRIAGTGWSVSLGRVRCSCQGRKMRYLNSDLKVIQDLAIWGKHESKRPCSDGCVQQILDSVIELVRVRSRRWFQRNRAKSHRTLGVIVRHLLRFTLDYIDKYAWRFWV